MSVTYFVRSLWHRVHDGVADSVLGGHGYASPRGRRVDAKRHKLRLVEGAVASLRIALVSLDRRRREVHFAHECRDSIAVGSAQLFVFLYIKVTSG